MTTTRIVRGTKARIFLYVAAVLIVTGVIACYNNTLSQLEDVRKSNEVCHQQEENLSTQLQVISDYKQRLEKSLKTEKAGHQQTKNDLESKLNDEKLKHDKVNNEANLRFNSLQQHSKILQTQYEDIQSKLKDLQDELSEIKSSKESLKSKYLELLAKNEHLEEEKANLAKQINDNAKENTINHLTKENHGLQRELEQLKDKCASQCDQAANNFENKKPTNKTLPEIMELESQMNLKPPNSNFVKSPTKSTTSSSAKISKASLDHVRPLLQPTMTPKTSKNASPQLVKLPEGVAPIPETRDEKKTEEEKNDLPNEAINSRYRNKINDISLKEQKKVEEEADKDNVGNEVFDQPHVYETFALNDDPLKNPEKFNLNKNHIDHLAAAQENKIDENDDNPQLEENEPDDDPDYADALGKMKEPAVRH